MKSLYGGLRAVVQRGVILLFLVAIPALAVGAPARTMLVMGDSLSAAYGLSAEQGWVALTAKRMRTTHPGWRVVNASISGETSSGGASRIAAELRRSRPALVVVELGSNDGLRGLDLAQTRVNLDRIIRASKAANARVLLLGMRMPPNFGSQYTRAFEQNYVQLARQHDVSLLPFFLAPIASKRDNFQTDNLHPVAAAQPKLRDHVWPALVPLLR